MVPFVTGPSLTLPWIVKVTVWPASTMPSASFEVLSIPIAGHRTDSLAESLPIAASPWVRKAVFGTGPHWVALFSTLVWATTWTELVPGGRSPLAVSALPTRLQVRAPVCDWIDHEKSGLSVSLTWTLNAVPWPLLATVIVKPIWLPIRTGAWWSADLAMPRTGQLTTTSASSVLLAPAPAGSLSAPIVTTLWSVPQSAKSVSPPMWITKTSPLAMSPRSQWRVPPEIAAHGLLTVLPFLVTFETVQATPAGSVSLRTTLTAASGPLFVTVIENAAFWPALIGETSAVFTTETSAHWTTIVASAELLPVAPAGSFEAETVTWFGMGPQSLLSTVPLMTMSTWAPAASDAKSQLSAPAAIEQPATGGTIAQF